jgi:hypothetical protein
MNAYDSILKFGKAQLNTNQNGEEMICFYPNLLKKGIEYTQFHTHLHPAKTLTDVEIVKIFQTTGFWQYSDLVDETDAIEFARAILRKAQEK